MSKRFQIASLGFFMLLGPFGGEQCLLAESDKSTASVPQDKLGFQSIVAPFFEKHCIACHGESLAESDLRLDKNISIDFGKIDARENWSEIVNALNSHEMPPESEARPADGEVAKVVDWATEQLRLAEVVRRDQRIVLRRLNRDEYRLTIRDLLGIDLDVSNFPLDPLADGFDNNGSALTISPMLMELYMSAARRSLDEAIIEGEASEGKAPKTIRWRFEPEVGNGDDSRVRYGEPESLQNPIVHGGNNPVVDGYKSLHHANWDLGVNARDFSPPQAGWYKVRVRAGAMIPSREQVVASVIPILKNRLEEQRKENPKGEQWHVEAYQNGLRHFETDPIYNYGPPRLKLTMDVSGQPTIVDEFDVIGSKDSMHTFEFLSRFDGEKTGLTLEYAYSIPKSLENFWLQSVPSFARPVAYVDWFEIEGPWFDAWPPTSHFKTLGNGVTAATIRASPSETARKTLANFMRRAYRRPATPEEIEAKLRLFDDSFKEGLSFHESIKIPLIAVLCSPNFLYLTEVPSKQGDAPVRLNQHEIAARLSYFLWSSMPDDELFRAASQGKLASVESRNTQVNRMLNDPHIEQFIENFSEQWLGLREVGSNPPSMDLYPDYDRHLEESMIEEGHAFFREVLKNDLSVMKFVRSDFVTINERLGRFYGIPSVRGDDFQRVDVPEGVHRGGVVTMAAIHTITSNGTRTSPVKRGTWVLKNLLGSDPGLPVANAGDIAPKVPGIDKATVRKRLEVHRSLAQCARCHNKIDPLGFALENYNAAGQWRTQEGFGYQGRIERDDPLIDASSKLPDGTKIDGVDDLRRVLLKKEELFLQCIAKKVFTYALGRELGIADQTTVKAACLHMQKNQYTLRSLIHFIVASELFQTK